MFKQRLILALTTAIVLAVHPETVQAQVPRTEAVPDSRPVPAGPVTEASGSGTQNQLAIWTDGAGTLGNSSIAEVSGSIGFFTASPTNRFHIFATATSDVFAGMGVHTETGPSFNFGYSGTSFGRGSGFLNVRPDGSAIAPNPSLRFLTANVQRMIITNIGRVGIGTTSPLYTLDVAGSGHFLNDLTVDGNIAAKYQDVAEWVPSDSNLSAGTVVVISTKETNEVTPSERAYDTRIAGVVSVQPGIALGTKGEGKYQIATLGRVRVKVDARQAPIRIGDLLVTSDTPGVAMKSVPLSLSGVELHRPGTLLGKALEPLESGQGEILVLLSLQ